MLDDALDRLVGIVTTYNLAVVAVLLVATVGVAMGVPNLDLSRADNSDAIGDTTVAEKQDYIERVYRSDPRPAPSANDSEGTNGTARQFTPTTSVRVYVHDPGGNVLSKPSLLETLRFQQRLAEHPAVADFADDPDVFRGVATRVARRAAGDSNASIDEQLSALSDADPAEVSRLVADVTAERPTRHLLPADYDPNASTAQIRIVGVRLTADEHAAPREAYARLEQAEHAISRQADAQHSAEYFLLDSRAREQAQDQWTQNTMELIVPFALTIILVVLAFVYRDLADILVGFTGVVVALLWMFGILGWLGVQAGATIFVGPVLIVGLSVDYGLHVFMRYREQRGTAADGGPADDEPVREPMVRSLRGVALALVLVTATTAVGFLANLTNDFESIRNLAVGITLGVFSALVIFTTLVPALKVTVDQLLERIGFDRRKAPLGEGRVLRPVLDGGVRLASVAAPVVVVVALVAGAGGAVAWNGLDRQGFQEQTDNVADWKRDLPGPMAWEKPAFDRHRETVESAYDVDFDGQYDRSTILLEGDVDDPAVLDALADTHRQLDEGGAVYESPEGRVGVESPLTMLRAVAEQNEIVERAFDRSDPDRDGVPEENVTQLYDALYAAAPDRADDLLERTDGEYQSLLVTVPVSESVTTDRQAGLMQSAAAALESASGLEATAVGRGTLLEAESIQTANSIFETLLIALGAVFVMLLVVYRLAEGTATLGAITAVPIALVTTLLVGSMYVLGVPLTFVTALLVSLVVGLGIDYSIHISDRYAQERDGPGGPIDALERAVTGTGGALLGSTLTSVGAFSAILLHPHPRFRSFGLLVVLALALSFLVSVYVLPSLLVLWERHVRPRVA